MDTIMTITTDSNGQIFVTTPLNEQTITVLVRDAAASSEVCDYVLQGVEDALLELWGR